MPDLPCWHFYSAIDPQRGALLAATLIGLCIRVKLQRSLPRRFKVDVVVAPGSHSTDDQASGA